MGAPHSIRVTIRTIPAAAQTIRTFGRENQESAERVGRIT
jgi:hypothetical protein